MMKKRYGALLVVLFTVSGCKENRSDEVGVTTVNVSDLNDKRVIVKNIQTFENDVSGKRNLLSLMANSVDHYNLVSGTMVNTLSYQGQKSTSEYTFQINLPAYQSYICLASAVNEDSQVIFRDRKRIYFFTGKLESLNDGLKELINSKKLTVTEIAESKELFKYQNLTLEERIATLNISRVANDLFGDTAPYLLPEDIALRQMGLDYDNYQIVGNEKYFGYDTYHVEGKINNDIYRNESTFSMLVEKQTGIVLKYTRITQDSRVEMEMKSVAIDQTNEEDLYDKYLGKK